MASKLSRQQKEQIITNLTKTTKLSREDITHLFNRFFKLCGKDNKGKLSRMEFRDELNTSFNITDDMLMDRVYRVFDPKSCGFLKVEDYVNGIAIFLNGSEDDRMQLCFDVYDVNSDGFISRDDMLQLLKHSLVKAPSEEDADEMVKDLIEIALKKLVTNSQLGKVTVEDFKKAVAQDSSIYEYLGKCLPDQKSCLAFLEMIRTFGQGESPSLQSINISQQKKSHCRKVAQSQVAV